MNWLWLVSVGVTDVQLPVWSRDEYGAWTRLQRFETGRAGIRAVHEGLLAMLRNGQVRFNAELPKPVDRSVARDLRLAFEQEGEVFVAAIPHPDYHISGHADAIPNPHEAQLPLYCPKVEALLPLAREMFGQESLTVLVLNTRRAEGFSEAALEPAASGPLVAKCLAERFGLRWLDGRGEVLGQLSPGDATWLDILTGQEAMEDPDAQQNVVARLNATIGAWGRRLPPATRHIVVTLSGGMPPLKPLIERVPATRLGQGHVRLLDQPERGPAVSEPLSYDTRVAEREALRFHCAEALREGDYTAAYGLASWAYGQPWARGVCDGLGRLLELPGAPLRLSGRSLTPFALTASRVEARLCIGDIVGALIRLGTFIENSLWELIAEDARIRRLGLVVDRDNKCLVGQLEPDNSLFTLELLENDRRGQDHHPVINLTRDWPGWLAQPPGGRQQAPGFLATLVNRWGGEPRWARNRLVHGSDVPIDPQEVEQYLKNARLIRSVGRPFGENFLAVPEAAGLLTGLGASDLAAAMSDHLRGVLDRLIEG